MGLAPPRQYEDVPEQINNSEWRRVKFVATYQPLWNGPKDEFDEYRTKLSILLKTRKDR